MQREEASGAGDVDGSPRCERLTRRAPHRLALPWADVFVPAVERGTAHGAQAAAVHEVVGGGEPTAGGVTRSGPGVQADHRRAHRHKVAETIDVPDRLVR